MISVLKLIISVRDDIHVCIYRDTCALVRCEMGRVRDILYDSDSTFVNTWNTLFLFFLKMPGVELCLQ